MAEVLGLVSSIISVLQITGNVVQYLHGVKHASRDTNRLMEEISSTSGILYALKDLVNGTGSKAAWANTCRSLNAPNGPLEHFEAALLKLQKKLSPRSTRQKTLFILALQNDHIKLSQEIQSEVREATDAIRSLQVSQKYQEERLRNAESTGLLDWLSPLNLWPKHHDISDRRQQGTGKWLIRKEEFQKWLECQGATLWCLGMPGAGKTILASLVIDYILDRAKERDIGLAFFYFNYKDQDRTVADVFGSILKQLIQCNSQIPEALRRLHEAHASQQTRPSLEEYTTMIEAETRQHSTTYLVIDALDEFSPDSNTRKDFLKRIGIFLPFVNLLVTSRYLEDIEAESMGAIRVNIRADDRDLEAYITEQAGKHFQLERHQKKDPSFLGNLIRTIISKADGMFLMAQLHLQAVAKEDNLRDARRALQKLPKELQTTYDDAIRRIQGQDERKSQRGWQVLMWVIYARRPLQVQEMQHALAVENEDTDLDEDALPDEESLISACAGLVILDKESDSIRLVHYTAEQYFRTAATDMFPGAHATITRKCLTYLSFESLKSGYCTSDKQFEARMQRFGFLDYAANNWGYHAREAPELTVSEEILFFLSQKSTVASFGQVKFMNESRRAGFSQKPPTNIPPLCVAALFNLQKIAELLLDEGAFLESENSFGQTALHVAAMADKIEMANFLLQQKNLDLNKKDKAGWTPLFYATMEGNAAIVKTLLLRESVDVNAKDNLGRVPLFYAVVRGYEAIIELFIERDDVDVNAKDNSEISILQHAVRAGRRESIKILLKREDLKYDLELGKVSNIMSFATLCGWEDIVSLLLGKDRSWTSFRDEHGRTLIFAAVQINHLPIVKLFTALEEFDVNAKDQIGLTPLSLAILSQGLEMTKFLIEDCGADYRSVDSFGRSNLHLCVKTGNMDILNYLLTLDGMDATIVDKAGNTLVHSAACGTGVPSAHVSPLMLKRVLSLPIAISPPPPWEATQGQSTTWSSLHWVCRAGTMEVVRLLLNDARIPYTSVQTIEPPGFWTPLDIARIHQNPHFGFRDSLTTEDTGWEKLKWMLELDTKAQEQRRYTAMTEIEEGEKVRDRFTGFMENKGFSCDFCSHLIYGPRFHCRECVDFDFCFMCKLTAEMIHPGHEMQAILP